MPITRTLRLAIAASLVGLAGCAHRPAREDAEEPAPYAQGAWIDGVQFGNASWYGGSLAGHRTSSGEPFDPDRLTAAHRSLPLGTWVEVRRRDTGDVVRVRINDRGPYGHPDRIIDLSREAAHRLGMVRRGVAPVEVRVVYGP